MRLTACSCGLEHLDRIPRSWWMRLFTLRRHYECGRCGARMFIPKVLATHTGPMLTFPAPSALPARGAPTE
jgi:hypothetical protein